MFFMSEERIGKRDGGRLHFDRPTLIAGIIAGAGAAIAIGVMEWFSIASRFPLAVIPFATSIVLVIGSPDAEPAQPRALIGGHLISTLVGLLVLKVTGPNAWAAAACGARDVPHRHLSSAGRDQSAAGDL
jgi:CBS-domain-containing membrane protein